MSDVFTDRRAYPNKILKKTIAIILPLTIASNILLGINKSKKLCIEYCCDSNEKLSIFEILSLKPRLLRTFSWSEIPGFIVFTKNMPIQIAIKLDNK